MVASPSQAMPLSPSPVEAPVGGMQNRTARAGAKKEGGPRAGVRAVGATAATSVRVLA